jgi:hypothetical protein
MHRRKIEFLVDDIEDMFDKTPVVIETDKGIQQNSAAVRLAEARAKSRQWHAERRLPGYAAKQDVNVNQRTTSLNLNINLNAIHDGDPADIQQYFKE